MRRPHRRDSVARERRGAGGGGGGGPPAGRRRGGAVGQGQPHEAGQRGAGAWGGGRGGGRGPAVVSPEVGADRTITFRFVAPNAQNVTVSGELANVTLEMTKGENGVWTATTPPL